MMAKIYTGTTQFLAGGERLLHCGPGSVMALTLSHAESSAQTVSLYDGLNALGTVLLRLDLPAGSSPWHIQFPAAALPRFEYGLFVDAGSCSVHVIATGVE